MGDQRAHNAIAAQTLSSIKNSPLVLLTISEFIGHLHPVLVHLPIGILLLACLFMWQSHKERYAHLQPAINTILLLGMISAILSCITGYILSGNGDYDSQLLGLHQWMGISVASISIVTYYCRVKSAWIKWQAPFAILLLILIFLTGHLGGSLTHGQDYLTQPLMNLSGEDPVVEVKRKPIPNVQEAMVYTDLVQPVFQAKCYGCHGPRKQKGKLRIDQTDLLMKGGKDGPVIITGVAEKSEMVKRINLPEVNEHHMPPKDKPQLNEREIKLLQWWINQGADFSKRVKDLQQPENMKSLLISFQNDTTTKKILSPIPESTVEKADARAIQRLRDLGVVILPVSQNSNYLLVDFITSVAMHNKDMDLLLPIKMQIAWLKLGNTTISDSGLASVGQCINITSLDLNHTHVTDRGIDHLLSLHNLQTINLVGTSVTVEGVLKLKGLKKLRSLYLFQSSVLRSDWVQLNRSFPGVELDSGGYSVPFLQTDTMIVKPPKLKQ